MYILESEGLEEQNEFMRHTGCCDGIFAVKIALQKRHEHGLGTWAVFIDLVKAFDSVPPNGLLVALDKFWINRKIKRLIMKFHFVLVVKVLVGEDDVCFETSTGVNRDIQWHQFILLYISRLQMRLLILYFRLLDVLQIHKWLHFTGRKTIQVSDTEFQFDKS